MMVHSRFLLTLGVVVLCLAAGIARGSATGYDYHVQGSVLLPDGEHAVPDYKWWYGCAPTAAGMVMAYYDLYGYNGHSYGNLIEGGPAELSNYAGYGLANPDSPVNQAIASKGHQHDFYSARDVPNPLVPTYPYNTGGEYAHNGMELSGDDVHSGRPFDCLADFMGSNQDSVGNPNGGTQFYYWLNGAPFTHADAVDKGLVAKDGMYGMGEYVEWRGYEVANLYTQLTSNVATNGFTFDDYQEEIDAGRVVMLHLANHSIFGFGYDAATGQIIFHDGWWEGEDRMAWGGSYYGSGLWGVTVMDLAPTPLPGAVLLGVFGLGTAGWRMRRQRA